MSEVIAWRDLVGKETDTYSVNILEETGLLPGAGMLFDRLNSGELGFTTSGFDHDVLVLPGDLAVVKRLKPTSGEALVWGMGVEPELIRKMQKEGLSVPKDTSRINWSKIIDYAHEAHGAITQWYGRDNFISTLFVLHGDRVFRVQPYAVGSTDEFAKRAIDTYNLNLEAKWSKFEASNQFQNLQFPIQKYYRFFHLDHGDRSNAVYYGATAKPPIRIRDY